MTINKPITQHIDNGVHLVWVMSLGPVSRVWRPLHLIATNHDDVHNMFFVITRKNTLNKGGVYPHETLSLQEL